MFAALNTLECKERASMGTVMKATIELSQGRVSLTVDDCINSPDSYRDTVLGWVLSLVERHLSTWNAT